MTPSVSTDAIRFGLYSIKNFGEGIADIIIAHRQEHGVFTSIENFLDRIQNRNLNKKSLESLIKAGAMDELGDRIDLLENLDRYLNYNKENARVDSSQTSMFDLFSNAEETKKALVHTQTAQNPETSQQRLLWEKELLGFYISGHPLDRYKDILEKREVNVAKTLAEGKQEKLYILGGIVENLKEIPTKKDPLKRIMFFTLKDLSGEIEVVVFPKQIDKARTVIQNEACIVLKAKYSEREDKKSLLFEDAKRLS
jgi:DNA polymerase-3 subunit alpha